LSLFHSILTDTCPIRALKCTLMEFKKKKNVQSASHPKQPKQVKKCGSETIDGVDYSILTLGRLVVRPTLPLFKNSGLGGLPAKPGGHVTVR
jgi:hypothetical protein